jgi:hypothetical protein
MSAELAGNSRFISSAQDGPHRDLDELVRRHMAHPFRKPIADYNREALTTALAARAAWKPRSAADSRCRLRRRLEHPAHRRNLPGSFRFWRRSVG